MSLLNASLPNGGDKPAIVEPKYLTVNRKGAIGSQLFSSSPLTNTGENVLCSRHTPLGMVFVVDRLVDGFCG